MLRKSRRLTSAEVAEVLKLGKAASSGPIRIKYTPCKPGAATSQFSVVVSKKIKKLAVDRNRLRRQMFAVLKNIKPPFLVEAVVFITLSSIKQKDMGVALEGAFSKMHR